MLCPYLFESEELGGDKRIGERKRRGKERDT